MSSMYSRDEYEYRIGYQYKDGKVFHTNPIDEREIPKIMERWRTKNRFLLLIDPWLESRRILKWQPCPMP